jgi:hypothetical protein
MLTKSTGVILFTGILYLTLSCSPEIITAKYYYRHEKTLDRIEKSYKDLYRQQPFTIAFTDRKFNTLSLEIITDTLSYIYEFTASEARLTDTLLAYHFNAPKVVELIGQMQSIRCTWVNKLDYYVDENKNTLVLMSIKPVAVNSPFSYNKYYTLTYFTQPQYFDSTGQLLDKRKLRRLRKISGDVFRRINDKVCYTISGNFR